jgi:hypothetical protein
MANLYGLQVPVSPIAVTCGAGVPPWLERSVWVIALFGRDSFAHRKTRLSGSVSAQNQSANASRLLATPNHAGTGERAAPQNQGSRLRNIVQKHVVDIELLTTRCKQNADGLTVRAAVGSVGQGETFEGASRNRDGFQRRRSGSKERRVPDTRQRTSRVPKRNAIRLPEASSRSVG